MITYTVTTLTDENDAGATVAVPGGTGLSLREAIALANANAGLDTIVFAVGLSGGTIRLTNAAGTLIVSDALQIVGDAGDNGTPDITITGDKNANDVTFAGGITNVFASDLSDNVQIFQATDDIIIDGLILTGGVTATSGSAVAVSGGAVRSTRTANVTDSVISGNKAVAGGGVFAQTLTFSNSTASFNDAEDGGGLYAVSLTLLNATISGNHASSYGGGAFADSATVVNATITGNDGAFQGGGIYGYSIDITNSIAIGNESQSNPNSLQAFILSRHGGNIIGSNNLGGVDHINVYSGETDVGDTTAAEVFAALSVSPISGVLSGTLADNGGGKPTIALKASLNNPALDASDSSAPATDARGLARVDHDAIPNSNGSAADLGAFEASEFPSLVVTTLADVVNAHDNLTSLREAVAYANGRPGADTISFAPGLSGGTIRLTNEAGTLIVSDALTIDGDINNDRKADITITGDKAANDVTTAGGITDVFATSSANLADNIQIFLVTAGGGFTAEGLVLTGGFAHSSGGLDEGNGGAIEDIADFTPVTVTNSTLAGNGADDFGGALSSLNSMLVNVTVSGNRAQHGGGIVSSNGQLSNVTISGNYAEENGGGFSGGGAITNSTITGNKAAGNLPGSAIKGGGGINGSPILINSIVAGNEAPANPDILPPGTSVPLAGGNIIGTNVFSGSTDVGDTTLAAVFASVSVNPYTGVLSGTLADNGGGVQTVALKASLSNPALDASNNAAPATDATGMGRVNQPAPNINGGTADLGAKEVGLFLPVVTGTSGDDSYDQPANDTRIDAGGGIDTITFHFKLTQAQLFYVNNTVVVYGPDGSHNQLSGFEIYKFTDGTVNNNDADPLVDDLYYYAANHDVWNAHADADAHFHQFGWHEGRNPDVFFSTQFYFAVYPEVRGTDPLVHFDQVGWKAGRLPSLNFDPTAYLAAYPDVKAAGLDPLAHFLQFGAGEGRQSVVPTELIAPNGFDYVYYLQHNPDVAAAGVDPFQHFQQFGWKEGRNPNALFDVRGYLDNYNDVRDGGWNPLEHYNQHGWHEGRDPSPGFDTTSYLAAYADVKAAGVNPLVHFLDFGIHEGRSPFADGVWG